jgi:integrase
MTPCGLTPRSAMGRPKGCWSLCVGQHGQSVTVYERRPGGVLYLRWWTPGAGDGRGQRHHRALKHSDRALGEQTARDIAAQLLASTKASESGRATVGEVFAAYEADVGKHAKGQGPKEVKRRVAIWTTFLGATRTVDTIDFPTLDRFVRERRVGTIQPAGHTLPTNPGNRAIAADLELLRAALNHATRVVRPTGGRLLTVNPMGQGKAAYELPRPARPRRPVVTYDRFLALLRHADAVDPQRLFGGFMMLVEGLGWRVSAICALRASHVDLSASPAAPRGRIYKNPDVDKEGAGGWIPMSESVRAGIDRIRAVNPALGDWPMFPAPRARVEHDRGKIPKGWTRHHARRLLERAEKKAELSAVEGSDFHAYRRKWATERKHLPPQDVAHAGAWLDLRSLQTAYTQPDDKTLLAVVSEPTKLRDADTA